MIVLLFWIFIENKETCKKVLLSSLGDVHTPNKGASAICHIHKIFVRDFTGSNAPGDFLHSFPAKRTSLGIEREGYRFFYILGLG